MSDLQEAKLAMADPGMERLHRLRKERSKQNEEIDILEMDGAFDGRRRNVSGLLHYIMGVDGIKKQNEGIKQPKIKLAACHRGSQDLEHLDEVSDDSVFSLDKTAAGRRVQEHQYCIALYDGVEELEELPERAWLMFIQNWRVWRRTDFSLVTRTKLMFANTICALTGRCWQIC